MKSPKKTAKVTEKKVLENISIRLIPFLMTCYFIAYVDRVNIGFASLTMNDDVGLTAGMFGFGVTLFFVAYVIFEMPSNIAMEKFGARKWLARIMVTWGIVGFCSAFITGPLSFGITRFLLGAAEAGFFPGVILYLTIWFPKAYMARIVAAFMVSVPLSNFLGSPLSAALLHMDGFWGFRGWQWLLMLEAVPAVLLGLIALFFSPRSSGRCQLVKLGGKNMAFRYSRAGKKEKELTSLDQDVDSGSKILAAIKNRYVLLLAIIYMSISATSNTLSLWMPKILKGFNLTHMQTGLLTMIPFGLGTIFMIVLSIRADKQLDHILSTIIPLAVTSAAFACTLLTDSLPVTLALFFLILIGNFSLTGPFWALTSETLHPAVLAAGIAAVNTLGHLGTGVANLGIGIIKEHTGSFPLALLPISVMTALGIILVLIISVRNSRKLKSNKQ
ncbi:MFS transporter [Serratia rubidaea]|nr:MFS transporter [Serratia rubidaea]